MTNDHIITAVQLHIERAYGLVYEGLRKDFDCNQILDALARAGLEADKLRDKVKAQSQEGKATK